MTTQTKILFWSMAWLLQVVLIGVILPSNWLEKQVESEREMTRQWMGGETASQIIEQTNSRFNSWFKDTGAIEASYGLVPTQKQKEQSGGLESLGESAWPYVEERIQIAWLTVYQALQRVSLSVMWLPFLLPLFIPAGIHGYCVRKIKQVSYGYASPVKYSAAGHAIALLSVLPLFYITLPIGIHPAAIFVWAIGVAILIMVMIANLQKQI